jgi:hypothetical protein
MTHAEFIEAYRDGTIRVDIDRKTAARFVAARLLLPLVMLPILGLGTALALSGWLWTGFGIIGAATLAPMLIKRSAPHFVMTQALEDGKFYDDAVNAGVLKVSRATAEDRGQTPTIKTGV